MKAIKLLSALLIIFVMSGCGPRGEQQTDEGTVIDSQPETELMERRAGEPKNDDPGLRQKVTPEPRRVAVDPESEQKDVQLQQREKKEMELQQQKKEEQKLELQRRD